jgi:hypothetical protein
VETYGQEASVDALQAVQSAAPTAPWPGQQQTIALAVAQELKERDESVTSPVMSGDLQQLTESHLPNFEHGLAIWLREFAIDPDEVWEVLRPIAGLDPPHEVADALRWHCAWWRREGHKADHQTFLETIISHAFEITLNDKFLQACLLDEGEHVGLAERLGEMQEQAASPDSSRQLLRIWSLLAARDVSVQRRLVNEVFLPIARAGGSYVDLALEFLDLIPPLPRDRRDAVRNALRKQGAAQGRGAEVEAQPRTAGLVKRGGLFKGFQQEDT